MKVVKSHNSAKSGNKKRTKRQNKWQKPEKTQKCVSYQAQSGQRNTLIKRHAEGGATKHDSRNNQCAE
jgi:hypothetical protein